MSPEIVLQKEPFRVFATTVIPGAMGTSTWIVYALATYPSLRDLWGGYRLELGLVYLAVAVLAGMIFEDLGSRIKVCFFDTSRQKEKPKHLEEWNKWLQLKTEAQLYGAVYMEATVVRFKFELNMIPACITTLLGGVLLLSTCPTYSMELLIGLVLLVILGVYLCVEAKSGHKLLANIRKLMLDAESSSAPAK